MPESVTEKEGERKMAKGKEVPVDAHCTPVLQMGA